MANLSRKAGLSQRYTNHCLSVTGINLLHESGMSKTDIAGITDHKNERSLERYIRKNENNVIRASKVLACEETTSTAATTDKITVKRFKRTVCHSGSESWEVEGTDEENKNTSVKKIINLNGTFNNCTFQF